MSDKINDFKWHKPHASYNFEKVSDIDSVAFEVNKLANVFYIQFNLSNLFLKKVKDIRYENV